MGLFSLLPPTVFEVLRHVRDLANPDRTALFGELASALSAMRGVDHGEAAGAVREVLRIGEAAMLDTPEGRAVVLQDAAEFLARRL